MNQYSIPITYAAKHCNSQVRKESRSGGVFTAISDYILGTDGIIYGCVMKDAYSAAHIRADKNYDRNAMRGSKYIESELGDTFKNIIKDLEKGRKVLFSGTPCQVDGLRRVLKKEYINLLTVDIICHGVPSPKIWRTYIEWQEKKYGSCISVDFRNKTDYGWASHVETMVFFHNGKYKKVNSRIFTNIFYSHLALRPSCYECKYKTVMHPGDITIADFWAIDDVYPGFNDNKGVSLVMINNDKGSSIFENIKPELEWKLTKYEKSIRPTMFMPAHRPSDRNIFWQNFLNKKFNYIVERYGQNGPVNRLKYFAKKIIYRKFKYN